MKIISLLAINLLLVWSCGEGAPIEVGELIANPSAYDGRIVTVRGCYSQGIEETTLSPCIERPGVEESIWIEFYSKIEWANKVHPDGEDNTYIKPDRKPNDNEERLARSLFIPGEALISVPVTFRGQFRNSEHQKFGHLSKFKYELVLHRVVNIGSRAADRLTEPTREDIKLGAAYIQVVAVDANGKSTLAAGVVVRITGQEGKIQSYAISNEAGLIYYMPLPPGRYCYEAFSKTGEPLRMVGEPSRRCFSLNQDSEENIGVEFFLDK